MYIDSASVFVCLFLLFSLSSNCMDLILDNLFELKIRILNMNCRTIDQVNPILMGRLGKTQQKITDLSLIFNDKLWNLLLFWPPMF